MRGFGFGSGIAHFPIQHPTNTAARQLPKQNKRSSGLAVFTQGPIGLCATAGAKLHGAIVVIGVDRLPHRLAMSGRMGAGHVVDGSKVDPVEEILCLTGGRGVDVAIETLGTQATFEAAFACCGRGAPCQASGCIRQTCRFHGVHSQRAWETTASSPRCALVARNACAG